METSSSELKEREQFYRVYFRKKRNSYKIVYKDIWARSQQEALELAKDYVRNTTKGKELYLISE